MATCLHGEHWSGIGRPTCPRCLEAREDRIYDLARKDLDNANAEIAKLNARLAAWEEWDDKEDEYTAAIKDAHPVASGSHELYARAMEMVSHRHSKGALVELVNWLLVECQQSGSRRWR